METVNLLNPITFSIITPVYNAEKWIEKCRQSVINQTYHNWEMIIIDDASTDKTCEVKEKNKEGWCNGNIKVIKNNVKRGTLANHILGLQSAKGDVIIHLDGDDWLENNNVLAYLTDLYESDAGLWATYGNYMTTDGSKSVCRPCYSNFREQILKGWCFSHLRTFRRWIASYIQLEDLKDSNGKLFSSAPDLAIFLPILEMSQSRVKYIEKTLAVYNRENPLNEDKDHIQDQVRCALEIYKKPKYNKIL